MVIGGITMEGLSTSRIYSCGVCRMRVKVNSVLGVQYSKGIHGICARVKRVIAKFLLNFACWKCDWNIEEAVEQEQKLYDEVDEDVGFE